MEPKDDVKARLGHSPDDADAIILAFYEVPAVARPIVPVSHSRSNPFSADRAG